MLFFDINNKWKLAIYRGGVASNIFSPVGWLLLLIHLNILWKEDILKRKQKPPKLEGKLETFFFLEGCLGVLFLIGIIIFQIFLFVKPI